MEEWENFEKNDSGQAQNDLLKILDDFASAVEMFTGFKQQFIAAGWSEEHAEELVIHILKGANTSNSNQTEG